MTHIGKIKVGVVGACGRGGSLAAHLRYLADASVQAVCDSNAAALPAAKERLGAAEAYTDYEEMLAQSDLHAVIVGTPMPLHVPQSILALERDLHVLSEVPAAVSLPQCRDLVAACQRSHATYMMAENTCYLQHVTLVTELVRQGLFGDVYYAEGEYLHELKGLSEITHWRRRWQIGMDGITYGSHPLGPILWWLGGDRVARLSCEGSGHHYVDPRGEPYCQDTSVMLGKMQRGALIKVRCDLVSNRPGCCNNWVLQGTRGALDTDRCGRYGLEDMRIWLADLCPGEKWTTLAALADRYLSEHWKDVPEEAVAAGHGGSDFLVLRDFIEAVTDRRPNPIGVHEALDMTLPGLVSQESIQAGGAWLEVPDSRQWLTAPAL